METCKDSVMFILYFSGFIQLRWTNLNPIELVQKMKDDFEDGDMVEEILLKSGISTAYQEKPCLDPTDVDCPDTAPNKASETVSEILKYDSLFYLNTLF